MGTRLLLLGLLSATAFVASCDGATADDGPTEQPPGTVVEDAEGISFTTVEFEVPEEDSFTCFYTDYITDKELIVVNGDGHQQKGGHHILVHYADEQREPGHHPCSETDMVNIHQVAGTAGDGGDILALPDGLAVKVPKGKQIVLEAHYINTTGAPFKAVDRVKLIYGDPAEIKDYVNYFVTLDEAFEIPPNGPLESVTECVLDRDFQVALALPHMHELGSSFKLEVLDEAGSVLDTPIDTEWVNFYVSHPPITRYTMEEPYMLKAGQRIRQTCTWQNTTTDPVIFPREMCLAFFYYWPGEGDIVCENVPVAP